MDTLTRARRVFQENFGDDRLERFGDDAVPFTHFPTRHAAADLESRPAPTEERAREVLEKIARAYDEWNPDSMFASNALFQASALARDFLATDTTPSRARP